MQLSNSKKGLLTDITIRFNVSGEQLLAKSPLLRRCLEATSPSYTPLFSTAFRNRFHLIGIQHFTNADFFADCSKSAWCSEIRVYLSGIVEIILGLSLMIPMSRKTGAKATAVFLVLIYWANANMWINDIPLQGSTFSTTAHVMRAMRK